LANEHDAWADDAMTVANAKKTIAQRAVSFLLFFIAFLLVSEEDSLGIQRPFYWQNRQKSLGTAKVFLRFC